MRRGVAVAALSAILIAVSSCSESADDGPADGAGTDKATACAALKQALDDGAARFEPLEAMVAQAQSDPAQAAVAYAELGTIVKQFEAEYGADAQNIADDELRAAVRADMAVLSGMTAAVEGAGGDVTKAITALQAPEFAEAGRQVKQLCELPH